MDDRSVIGEIGKVSVSIPAGGPGEVMLRVRGGMEAFAAWADQVVPRHTQVLVIDQLSGRSVLVTPFSSNAPGPKEA